MGSMKSGTGLSQHWKELVMFLLDASNHADWKRKSPAVELPPGRRNRGRRRIDALQPGTSF